MSLFLKEYGTIEIMSTKYRVQLLLSGGIDRHKRVSNKCWGLEIDRYKGVSINKEGVADFNRLSDLSQR
jgi:hypothetical protein